MWPTGLGKAAVHSFAGGKGNAEAMENNSLGLLPRPADKNLPKWKNGEICYQKI